VKEVHLKRFILYDDNYRTFLKRQNYEENKKISSVQEQERGGEG
jgi:hypothetical protein